MTPALALFLLPLGYEFSGKRGAGLAVFNLRPVWNAFARSASHPIKL
jgi:hypothetical protein